MSRCGHLPNPVRGGGQRCMHIKEELTAKARHAYGEALAKAQGQVGCDSSLFVKGAMRARDDGRLVDTLSHARQAAWQAPHCAEARIAEARLLLELGPFAEALSGHGGPGVAHRRVHRSDRHASREEVGRHAR